MKVAAGTRVDEGTLQALVLHFFEASATSGRRLLNAVDNDRAIDLKARSRIRSLIQWNLRDEAWPISSAFLGLLLILEDYSLVIRILGRTIELSAFRKIIHRIIDHRLKYIPGEILPIVRLIIIQSICQYRRQQFSIGEIGSSGLMRVCFRNAYLRALGGAMREIRKKCLRFYPAIRSFVIIDRDHVFFSPTTNRDRSIAIKAKRFLCDLSEGRSEIDRFACLLLRMDIARMSIADDAGLAAKEVCEIVRILRGKKIDNEWLSKKVIDQIIVLINCGSRTGMQMLKRLAAELQGLVEEVRDLDDWDHISNLLNINFHIGRALMAAMHYREAEIFMERALSAFNVIADQNKYVRKYFRYQRHTIEALLEQNRMDTEAAIASIKMAHWSADDLRRDWRYYSRVNEGARGFRRRKDIRCRFKDLLFVVRVHVACFSEEYRKFLYLGSKLKWPTPGAGVKIAQLIKWLDLQVERAENGHRLRQDPDSPVHRSNLAEQALDTESIHYLLGFHTRYSDELLGREKIIEFYHLSGGKCGTHQLHPGCGVTLAQEALKMCLKPQEFPDDIRQQEFIVFSINKLKQEIDKYIFSVSTVVFMFMMEVGRVLRISENWRLGETTEFLEISQIIFDKLENERLSMLHQDDRSGIDKMLETIYIEFSQAALLAGRASRGGSGMLLLEHAIFWRDRARYRWLTAGYNQGMTAMVNSLDISSSLRSDFFSAEERLRKFVASRPSRFVFGTAVGDKRGHNSCPLKRGMKSKITASEADDAESFESYEAAQRDYLAALHEIKKVIPEFEWHFQAKILMPISILAGRLRGEIVVHFVCSEDLVFVLIHYRRKFGIFSMPQKSLREIFQNRVVPVCGTEFQDDLGVLFSVRSMIKRFERESALRRSSPRKWLRLFIDPVLTILPIHRLLIEGRYSSVVHGCSVSSAAMNERSRVCEERVTVIAPYKELRFSAVEARSCWKACTNLVGEQTITEVVEILSSSSIVHYCGHLSIGEDGGLICPVRGGVLTMDLAWLIENLSFNDRPLVILNTCRSGVSNSSKPPEVFERERNYLRETEIKRASVSYASCFLSLGASAVVATSWDVDDCVAFVFAWRFARSITRYPKRQIEELFFKTVVWCKSLTDLDADSAILGPLVDSLSEREHSFSASEILQRIAEEQKRVKDEYGVDCWDAFLIYR